MPREDYEHLELDYDGFYYWFMNKDVNYSYNNEKELIEFHKWFNSYEDDETKTSLYYKSTRLYYTYKGKKYFEMWTFYSKKLIKLAIKKLKQIKATNIKINYGELD